MAEATNYILDNPGVQAFQGQQLDSLILLFLAEKANYTLPDDLTQLIDLSVCDKCFTDTQLKQDLASFLWTSYSDGSTADEQMAKIACLNCVDPQTIKALINYLLIVALTPAIP